MRVLETKEIECHSCRISNYGEDCSTTICIQESGCFSLQKVNSSGITDLIEHGCLYEGLSNFDKGCFCLDDGGYFCFEPCYADLCNEVNDISADFDSSQCGAVATTTTKLEITTTIEPMTSTTSSTRIDLILGLTMPLVAGLIICVLALCLRQRQQ